MACQEIPLWLVFSLQWLVFSLQWLVFSLLYGLYLVYNGLYLVYNGLYLGQRHLVPYKVFLQIHEGGNYALAASQ